MNSYEAVLFDLYGTLVNEHGEAIDGALGAVQALPDGRWAIVTSCPQRLAIALVRHAELPQPRIFVTSDDVKRGKPAPDCYLLAAERLGLVPEGCLVLEDSLHGVCAAKAAGMDVIHVSEVALRDLAFEVDPDTGRVRVRH